MMARVGELAVGTKFLTGATRRPGRCVADGGRNGGAEVELGSPDEIKTLHPDVLVDVVHEDFVH